MARQVKANDFENAFEYEQARKALKKADKNKRVSANGRKAFESKGADE